MEKGEHKSLSISWSIALFTTMDEPMDTRRAGACLPRINVFFELNVRPIGLES